MNAAERQHPLRGLSVLVTRPAHQAATLCEAIEARGGTAIRFPVLEIAEPEDPDAVLHAAERLEGFDFAVFVSANAVSKTLDRILSVRQWPDALPIAVIGERSGRELQRYGMSAALIPPHQFNSEALLAMPELARVAGKRFIVFRGTGGRELLADTLRGRGAQVEYVEAYRRRRPDADPEPLLRRWRAGEQDLVLAYSAESLHNLLDMVGGEGADLVTRMPLVVVSPRMVELAGKLGFDCDPVVAANASDDAVLSTLLARARLS